MHDNILTEKQKKLLPFVGKFSNDFYLVGGTALALQYGHRRSIDFDLFTKQPFDNMRVRKKIHEFDLEIDKVHIEATGEFTLIVSGMKMTFYHYDYEIEHDKWLKNVVSVPDDLIIGAMKAFALGYRAKWKDYVDLSFVLKRYELEELVKKTKSIYPEGEFDERLFREQLAYHKDIDYREPVEYMPGFEVSEEEVKEFLTEVAIS